MRLTTSKGREFAFTIQKKRNKRRGKHEWYVGISFKKHLAIDLDKCSLVTAIRVAKNIQQIYSTLYRIRKIIDIHETKKGYWLIMRYVPNQICRKMWALILNNFGDVEVCKDFIKISLKYNKATLRVSKKANNIPKKVGLIDLHGNFLVWNELKKVEGLYLKRSVEEIAETTISHTA